MALIEQVGVKDAIASKSVAGGAVNPSTSDNQDRQLLEGNMGDQGPTQQHEVPTGLSNQPEREQLVIDTNMMNALGTQPLTNAGRIKVEDAMIPEQVVSGAMFRANDEVKIPLTGMGTVTLQTQGTWTGTISFFGSVDGQTWNAIQGQTLNSTSYITTSSTVQTIARFSTAGLTAFKVQFTTATSGRVYVILVATPLPVGTAMGGSVTAANQGSNATTVLQNVLDTTNGRLIVQDTGYTDAALQNTLPYDPSQAYFTGNTAIYNGRIYRALQYVAANTANNGPSFSAFWAVERNQFRSVITALDPMTPQDARVKVQLDLTQYTREAADRTMLIQAWDMMHNIACQEQNALAQSDTGFNYNKAYGLGQDASAHYIFEEVR